MKKQNLNSKKTIPSSLVLTALSLTAFSMLACSEPVTDLHGNLKPKFAPAADTSTSSTDSASKPLGTTEKTTPDGTASGVPVAPASGLPAPSQPSGTPSAAAPSGTVVTDPTAPAAEISADLIGKYRFKIADCLTQSDQPVAKPLDSFPPAKSSVSLEIQKSMVITKVAFEKADGGCAVTISRKLVKNLPESKSIQLKADDASIVFTKNDEPAKADDCDSLKQIAAQAEVTSNVESSSDGLKLSSDSYFCTDPTMALPDTFNDVNVVDELQFVK